MKVILITVSFLIDGTVTYGLRPPVFMETVQQCKNMIRERQLTEYLYQSEMAVHRICMPIEKGMYDIR